ncbi:VOC family protein [Nocardia sp. NPDC059240]|uniref:VOC family protein n=1 Tax=Nocardia sp. NPDC059240 TaxID=3346786 RepID=UPI00368B9B36
MKITASTISLNVPDPITSAKFVIDHLGFTEKMSADGFVNVAREDAAFEIAYLRTGLSSFQPEHIAGSAGEGLLLAFAVDGVDAEYARLQEEGVPIVTAIQTEPWGQRFFQVSDPNGIIIELFQMV